jgi:hypothetical protein
MVLLTLSCSPLASLQWTGSLKESMYELLTVITVYTRQHTRFH